MEYRQAFLLTPIDGLLVGIERDRAAELIVDNHYTRSVPSGKSYFFRYGEAVVVFSIPANRNLAKFVLGFPGSVWELTRLWAPDGHEHNLLTQAISQAVRWLTEIEPDIDALVSYADPNAGHKGGVYRAASWIYHGQSTESRYYQGPDGEVVARRKFHSGGTHINKDEILALGYEQLKRPGKHRFVRPLSKVARRQLRS